MIAERLATTCPAASRYVLSNLERNDNFKCSGIKSHQYCKYCGSLWIPGNHKVQIQPIQSNRYMKKLLKREEKQPWRLNNQQKKKLRKLKNSTNKIIYTCDSCKKTTKFPGLKKYCMRKGKKKLSFPIQKIKRKKRELNAGLFIETPVENKLKKYVPENKQELSVVSKKSSKIREPSYSRIPKFSKRNVTSKVKTSAKKKKTLAKILNEKAKKPKHTFYNFLSTL